MNGPLSWTGATISGAGTFNSNGGATLSGGLKTLQSPGRVMNLSGTSTWSAGGIDLYFTAVLTNTVGSTFTNTFSGEMRTPSGTGGTFNNAGTFTKNTSSGTTTIEPVFNNTGIVNVDTGTLLTNGGGTSTGAWNVATGATLTFGGGTYNLNAGSTFSGAGTVSLTTGTLTVNGATTSSASTLFSISGGSFNGTGTLTVNGPLSWTGATISGAGTFNSNGGATLSGGLKTLQSPGRVMNLSGTSTWSAGGIDLYFTAVLTNTVGSTFTNTFSGEMRTPSDTGGTFNNAGTFTKNTSSGTTTIQPVFNNTGIVNVDTGTLSLSGGVTQHSGATLTGGNWNVTGGSTLNINTGSNITTLGSSASVTLDGAGSSFAKVTTALATNQGNFTLKNNRDLTTAGAYANSGTTRVEDSTTVMTIGSGGSAAYTQTIGETVLVGGAIIDASVFNLNSGELKGNGTIASSVVTGGTNTIAPGFSPGALTIEGNLTLSAGSTLEMEIGGLTQGTLYDYLDVNGALTLAGLLNLSFLNDFQNSLSMGSLFTLATSDAAVLGSFSNVANGGFLTDMASLHTFSVHYGAGSLYNPNNVVLYAVTPEPGRALLLMLGLLGLTLRRKRHACAVDSASV